jgi:inositol-phosphate phosphatase/L-galactose 1-phosphate phosphatase/histidinol-phosphatase
MASGAPTDIDHQTRLDQAFIDLAGRLADASGTILRNYYRRKVAIIDKPDETPVTQADRECESTLRGLIAEAFPAHGIVGEEFGTERGDADYVWVLDPLDGTKAFVTGRPLYGTLIALLYRDRPIMGVIDMPILRDRWIGAIGRPTTLNGETCAVRPCPALSAAYLSTVSPLAFPDRQSFEKFEAVRQRAKTTTYGGDCYQYGMVATGFIDLVIEANLGIYDFLALAPIIEGAGGIITNWQGEPLTRHSGDKVLACGDRRVHAETLPLLQA